MMKAAVSIVQPYLQSFTSEGLLDNDIGGAVSIYVQSRYCERGLVRFKDEFGIFSASEMKLYCSEAATSFDPTVVD
jgi:hypothetical protein